MGRGKHRGRGKVGVQHRQEVRQRPLHRGRPERRHQLRLPDPDFRAVRFECLGGDPGKPSQDIHRGQSPPPILGGVVDEPGQGLGIGTALLRQPAVEGPGRDPDVGGVVVQPPGDRDLSVQDPGQSGTVAANVLLDAFEGRERGVEFQQPREPFAAGPRCCQPVQDRTVHGVGIVGPDGPAHDAGDLRQVLASTAEDRDQTVRLVVLAAVGLGPEGLGEPRHQGLRGDDRDGQEQVSRQRPPSSRERGAGAGIGQSGQHVHLFLDWCAQLGTVDHQPPERALQVRKGLRRGVAGGGQHVCQTSQTFGRNQVQKLPAGNRQGGHRGVAHRVLFRGEDFDTGEGHHDRSRIATAQRRRENRVPGRPAFLGVARVQAGFCDGEGLVGGEMGCQPQLLLPPLVDGQPRHPGRLRFP